MRLERIRHGDCQRRRGPADQRGKLPPIVEERTLRRADIPSGNRLCQYLRRSEAGQRGCIFRFRQVLVGDRPAGLAGDLGRQLGEV